MEGRLPWRSDLRYHRGEAARYRALASTATTARRPAAYELLSDPIMHMLMAADRVEYRDLEAVLQRAPSQLCCTSGVVYTHGPWATGPKGPSCR